MSRIFLTGISGNVGSYILERILAKQVTKDAQDILGRSPKSIKDFILDYKEIWI